MHKALIYSFVAVISLAGCVPHVAYRNGGYAVDSKCRDVYEEHHSRAQRLTKEAAEDPCWTRAREVTKDYDLLFVEFDDQGWAKGGVDPDNASADALTQFFTAFKRVYAEARDNNRGLSLVVFVHGWDHNARAADEDVQSFRSLLRDMAKLESSLAPKGRKPMRVVGIYVGWRGESVPIPGLNLLTFWERKNSAERIAQGTVRELFARLDYFRDRERDEQCKRNTRMLTIGHSFGGLITFESMSGEMLRNIVRFKERPDDPWISRVGDLVVIVNPAFEGARYESLRAAGGRLEGLKRGQLPAVITVTSRADVATRYAFPIARWFSTLLETQEGEEGDAAILAVGHNPRFITHDLRLYGKQSCAPNSPEEFKLMRDLAENGVSKKQVLCGNLELEATDKWSPEDNPFWVVRTTGDVIKNHGDIFNPNFVEFVRQMYLAFVYERFPDQGEECKPDPRRGCTCKP